MNAERKNKTPAAQISVARRAREKPQARLAIRILFC
jgi:hypothetical protein